MRITKRYSLFPLFAAMIFGLYSNVYPQVQSIPEAFVGAWVEIGKRGESLGKFVISPRDITWERLGEDSASYKGEDLKINQEGSEISFKSKVTYARNPFLSQVAHKGDVIVTLIPDSKGLIVKIGGMKVDEGGGVVVSRPPEEHLYQKPALLKGDIASSKGPSEQTASATATKGWQVAIISVEKERILKQRIGGTLMMHLASVSGGDTFLIVSLKVKAPKKDAKLLLATHSTYVMDQDEKKFAMKGKFDKDSGFDPSVVEWTQTGSGSLKLAFPISAASKKMRLKLSEGVEPIPLPIAPAVSK